MFAIIANFAILYVAGWSIPKSVSCKHTISKDEYGNFYYVILFATYGLAVLLIYFYNFINLQESVMRLPELRPDQFNMVQNEIYKEVITFTFGKTFLLLILMPIATWRGRKAARRKLAETPIAKESPSPIPTPTEPPHYKKHDIL